MGVYLCGCTRHLTPPSKRAFTLVELSIVLVILGLLVGGVIAGQALIRSAEIRKHLATVERYKTALHTFKDKYFMMPGDMTNASSFWPGVGNGNGDGAIQNNFAFNGPESLLAWVHLSRAGLIEGNFANSAWVPGVVVNEEVPPSPLGKSLGYSISYAITINPNPTPL